MAVILKTPEQARTEYFPSKLGSLPFFNEQRIITMRNLLAPLDGSNRTSIGDKRLAYEWNSRVMSTSSAYIPQGPLNPWDIPGTYDDPEASSIVLNMISQDFNTAVDLALRWRALGDSVAAQGAIRILTAWAVNSTFAADAENSDNGALVWSSRWPVLLQAAMMVRDHPSYTPTLETALRNATMSGAHISMAHRADNNTGTWGIVWEFAVAMFMSDAARFDRAVRRWQSNLNNGVQNNIPVHEIYRHGGTIKGDGKDGLWYSNFFVYALTVAAEWARFGGKWLYDHVTPDGSTFKGLALKVRGWSANPSTFPYNTSESPTGTSRSLPHDEILHALWPDKDSQWMVEGFPTGSDRDSTGFRGAVLAYRYRPLWG